MTKRTLKAEFEPGCGYTQESWEEVMVGIGLEAQRRGTGPARPFAEVFPELAASIKHHA